VWQGFPDVQWLVPYQTVSNTGAPTSVSYKDFTSYGKEYIASKNADWYFAKGKGDGRILIANATAVNLFEILLVEFVRG